MLEKEEILRKKVPVNPPSIKGIYFLLWRKKFAYIGQSVDCHRRIYAHRSNKKLAFDSYFILETPDLNKKELEELETKYIIKFLPKHNKKDRPRQEILDLFYQNFSSIEELCQRTNLSFTVVDKFLFNRYGTSKKDRMILLDALHYP